MSKLHVKTGDTVVLLTGDKKDRKKTGKVLEVSPKEGKVIVEGINVVKKHAKPKKAASRPVSLKPTALFMPARFRLFARNAISPPE